MAWFLFLTDKLSHSFVFGQQWMLTDLLQNSSVAFLSILLTRKSSWQDEIIDVQEIIPG